MPVTELRNPSSLSGPPEARTPDAPSYGLEIVPSRVESPGKVADRARRRGVDCAMEALAPDSEIRGWFLPPPDVEVRGIRAVQGKKIFVARRKQLRPEVLAEHPDRPGALFSGFSIALQLDLGWNRFELQFKDGDRRWRPFCNCHVRLPWLWRIHRKLADPAPASAYEAWIRKFGDPDAQELRAMRGFLERLPRRPLLSVLMPVYNTPERWLRRAIESVREQVYPDWELCLADDCSPAPGVRRLLSRYARRDPRIRVCFREENGHICSASNSALEMCTGEFTVLLDHDDELPPHALFHVAWELVNHPSANIIFSDEDKVDEADVRSGPYFKPGWNYDLLLSQNCVSHLGAFRTSLLREIGGFRPGFEGSQDWDVTLRALARCGPGAVRHIPRVLYHWRSVPSSAAAGMHAKPYAAAAGREAVEDHLQATGTGARVLPLEDGAWRVLWPLPEPTPRVSLIIPTKDHVGQLSRVLESHFDVTRYPAVDVIVVDHQSKCRAARGYLNELRRSRDDVRIVAASGSSDWSVLGNLGAREASGEILVFLGNDLEITEARWLEELVRQASRRDVGAVGACLLHPDGTIQHAGIVLQMTGLAGHVFQRSPVEAPSIGGPPNLVREVTAVSGACLAVRREVFERAGGFDTQGVLRSWKDLDLCLRLRSMGMRNIYTPFARLVRREDVAQGGPPAAGERRVATPEEARLLLERWPREFSQDSFYNPNLSLNTEIPVLAAPRLLWPWLDARAGGQAGDLACTVRSGILPTCHETSVCSKIAARG